MNDFNDYESIIEAASLDSKSLIGSCIKNLDLSNKSFTGIDFTGVNFTNSNLLGVTFCGANLSWTNLTGANIHIANFEGTNFRETVLDGIRNYSTSHIIFLELIKRLGLDHLSKSQLAGICKIMMYKNCYNTIIIKFGQKPLAVFKKLSKIGFSEYEKKYIMYLNILKFKGVENVRIS